MDDILKRISYKQLKSDIESLTYGKKKTVLKIIKKHISSIKLEHSVEIDTHTFKFNLNTLSNEDYNILNK